MLQMPDESNQRKQTKGSSNCESGEKSVYHTTHKQPASQLTKQRKCVISGVQQLKRESESEWSVYSFQLLVRISQTFPELSKKVFKEVLQLRFKRSEI